MRVRNESARTFIIKGVSLPSGRVMEIEESYGRKLCEAYKGELVSLEDLQEAVVIPTEAPAEEAEAPVKEQPKAKKKSKK